MNKVFLIGNLTRDPELSSTTSGISYCRFTLAVSRNFASKDGKRETDFINIRVWRALADNCAKYLKKVITSQTQEIITQECNIKIQILIFGNKEVVGLFKYL